MKSIIQRKSIIVLIILTPLIADLGCKKQPKCGCGKDVLFEINQGTANVYYTESSRSAFFYSTMSTGSTYYFCNPGKWIDTLKTFKTDPKTGQLYPLLISGKAYYECSYLMNSGNYGYYIPPVYQVEVTAIEENNYAKK
jgi:YHS domain-containing protein